MPLSINHSSSYDFHSTGTAPFRISVVSFVNNCGPFPFCVKSAWVYKCVRLKRQIILLSDDRSQYIGLKIKSDFSFCLLEGVLISVDYMVL